MTQQVPGIEVEYRDVVQVKTYPLPAGGISTSAAPLVALVVASGFTTKVIVELSVEDANILGEYLRQAAEAATPNQGEN